MAYQSGRDEKMKNFDAEKKKRDKTGRGKKLIYNALKLVHPEGFELPTPEFKIPF